MSFNWKGVRVLVTGAGGFIGSHLTEELARRGAKVRAMVRYNSRNHWGFLEETPRVLAPRIDILPGDVSDPFCMMDMVKGQQVIFHLAALIAIPYSYQAPASYAATNVTGTLNVLEACRRRGVRKLVHTSTSETYGTARYTPIDEEHPMQGQSPYSASKIAADKMVESYQRSFGVPVAVVRPFNTYGPRQSARAVLPTIISQVCAGRKTLDLGDLRPVRDFNFVSDTVEGFIAAAASPKSIGEVINIGSGRAVSIGQAARTILRLTGCRPQVRKDSRRLRPVKSEVFKLLCDNRKARRLIGWRPLVPLEEGLTRTIAYVRAHPDRYKTHLYNV